MLKLIKYTAAHLKWNALRALLQIAGWYLVVEHTNCSILNVQRSKSSKVYISLGPPYAINPILCKNPCFNTTHLDDYKNPVPNNKYSNIKSKLNKCISKKR